MFSESFVNSLKTGTFLELAASNAFLPITISFFCDSSNSNHSLESNKALIS